MASAKPVTIASCLRTGGLVLLLAAPAIPAQAVDVTFTGTIRNGASADAVSEHHSRCTGRLTPSELQEAVMRQGYEDIHLDVAGQRRVVGWARQGGWVYELRVSTCTGNVLVRDQLRRS